QLHQEGVSLELNQEILILSLVLNNKNYFRDMKKILLIIFSITFCFSQENIDYQKPSSEILN